MRRRSLSLNLPSPRSCLPSSLSSTCRTSATCGCRPQPHSATHRCSPSCNGSPTGSGLKTASTSAICRTRLTPADPRRDWIRTATPVVVRRRRRRPTTLWTSGVWGSGRCGRALNRPGFPAGFMLAAVTGWWTVGAAPRVGPGGGAHRSRSWSMVTGSAQCGQLPPRPSRWQGRWQSGHHCSPSRTCSQSGHW